METTINLIRGVVTLDEETYRAFLSSENVMKRGFLILLVCFFIGTFPVFGQRLISGAAGLTPQAASGAQEQMRNAFELYQPANMDDETLEVILHDVEVGMNMGVALNDLPTPLPRPLVVFFQALGAWVTATLRAVGPWLGYGAIVLLSAKLAGGRGVLNPFFGLTALYAVPHLLQIFGFIPFLAPILGLVAAVWGIAVYIRAVQISQEFSGGKAVLITFLPFLILLLLVACIGSAGLSALIGLIASAQ